MTARLQNAVRLFLSDLDLRRNALDSESDMAAARDMTAPLFNAHVERLRSALAAAAAESDA